MPHDPRAPYDAIAEEWDTTRTQFWGTELAYLDLLLDGVPPGSRVLDLGCGTGRPIAAWLVSRGYHVVGIDASAALLNLARRHMPQGEWIEADILTVDPPGPFAAAICWDAMFHIERAHHRRIIEKLHACLLPAGRLMLSSGGADADIPAFTDTMFGHTFSYDAFPKDETVRIIRQAGFDIVLAELATLPDGGRDKGKLAVIAAKLS